MMVRSRTGRVMLGAAMTAGICGLGCERFIAMVEHNQTSPKPLTFRERLGFSGVVAAVGWAMGAIGAYFATTRWGRQR